MLPFCIILKREVRTLFVHVKMQEELAAAAQTIPSVLVLSQWLLF